jgi:hypothetical protein
MRIGSMNTSVFDDIFKRYDKQCREDWLRMCERCDKLIEQRNKEYHKMKELNQKNIKKSSYFCLFKIHFI